MSREREISRILAKIEERSREGDAEGVAVLGVALSAVTTEVLVEAYEAGQERARKEIGGLK